MPAGPSLDVATLIDALSRPEAYAHAVDKVEVHQTHISVVFLAGPFAYKIKKPVNFGFIDFSTLEKRKHFCEEEIRLNCRLAPQVYLGVAPVTQENGTLRLGGNGTVVEWAVQMKRLPGEATLEYRLARGEGIGAQIRALAKRVASFHRTADFGKHIASFGRFAVVAHNARENFKQAERLVGTTVCPMVFERVRELTEAELATRHDLIERRAEQEMPRDTHGDLRLDHVYLFPDEASPDDLVIIDCIEFADRFRYADPVADMAFLVMDLSFHGQRDLARSFGAAYFEAIGDPEGRPLVPFYSAYRAVVRAKVEGMELTDTEIDPDERHQAIQRARAHWLLALGELEKPIRRPALVLMAGLPGSGKSTLARFFAQGANFSVLRSDLIRKELAGDAETAEFNQGIYTEEWTERTYAELLKRCEQLLWQGERVLIDANFRDDRRRQAFFEAALRWAVPLLFIHCLATPEITRARLQARRHDASDADWLIYERLAQTWQPIRPEWLALTHVLNTSGSMEENERNAIEILRQNELIE